MQQKQEEDHRKLAEVKKREDQPISQMILEAHEQIELKTNVSINKHQYDLEKSENNQE
ncbi:hypothetical protein SAMN05444392_101306 [Seinonella peptonophila]|uniref:Uncharacterized protein n=1 Tax=Seinonella peptonophila TaxID=112248 RepID=A0A1M4T4I9_9BACL|nr:hypothetical protein [Seinonella peptonophila]SHE39406.1 hypothetical protein SAMN05444392_101306 [Seinonella peptonophila]